MPRARTPRPQPAPDADPLADLRQEAAAQAAPAEPTPAPAPAGQDQETDLLVGLPEVFDADWHRDAVARVVQRWHDDMTASRYAHKGGSCGCAYLARLALTEAVGIAAPPAGDDPDGPAVETTTATDGTTTEVPAP